MNGSIEPNQRVARRRFLHLLGLAGTTALATACSPNVTSSPPAVSPPTAGAANKPTAAAETTAPAAQKPVASDWEKVVDAANGEGQVVITTLAGDGYRKLLDQFHAAYPRINVEHKTVASASFLAPQVAQEQQGGVYSYDVALLSPGGPVMGSMMPNGDFSDIRPVITQPDVVADTGWVGGFESGWMDRAKQKVYGFSWDKNVAIWRNRDLVPDGEVKTARDLLNPKWKGKILFLDYTSGFTYNVAAAITNTYKDQAPSIIKGIFVDQQPAFERDGRATAEALIRGQYAMATGPNAPIMSQFYNQNIGKNVVPLDLPDTSWTTMYALMQYMKAPHPNAGKVLINWLLSKQGGVAWTANVQLNSRRADVPVYDAPSYPGTDFTAARRDGFFPTLEENLPLQQAALDQLKQLIVS